MGNHYHRKLRPQPLLKQSVKVYRYQGYDDSVLKKDINPPLSGHKTLEWYLIRFPHHFCSIFLIIPYSVWSLENLKPHVWRCDRKPVFCNKCILLFYHWGFIAHANASPCRGAAQPAAFQGGADSAALYRKGVLLLFEETNAAKLEMPCKMWLSCSKLISDDCIEAIWPRLYINENSGFFFSEHPKNNHQCLNLFLLVPSCILYISFSQKMVACILCTMPWKSWRRECTRFCC